MKVVLYADAGLEPIGILDLPFSRDEFDAQAMCHRSVVITVQSRNVRVWFDEFERHGQRYWLTVTDGDHIGSHHGEFMTGVEEGLAAALSPHF